jgi:exodeoxyribonuclease VII small subunit
MSRRAEMKKTNNSEGNLAGEAGEGQNFEASMERLEALVTEMEEDDLPLEEMLKRFQEGSGLIQACRQQLEEAKQTVEVIMKNNASEVKLNPFSSQEEE